MIGQFRSTGERLDKALAQETGLSRERVKSLLAEGRVAMDGKAVRKPPRTAS